MPVTDLPSIQMYALEDGNREDLDLAYVDALAGDIAARLRAGEVAECAYQPGDGTRYAMVLTPLSLLRPTRPRVKDGVEWDNRAVSGMFEEEGVGVAVRKGIAALNQLPYAKNGYLLSLVEGACYPVWLGDRGVLAGDYVREHWKLGGSSAVTVALLLRAISYHLDHP